MQDNAPVIYAYPDLNSLIEQEAAERRRKSLPRPGPKPVTERPNTGA